MLKGDRMMTMNKDRASIIDLSKETITEVDFAKKTYSVMTFAEMKQAMEDAMSRMQKGNDKADVKWDVKAKATGQTKTIQGLEAKEIITTMNKDRPSIIDLSKETITEVDFAKKTYSVMTFAEMKQAMEDAMSRMQKGNDKADVKWDVKAKATGQTKTIQGLEAKEIITTM